jgi:hypothetical protein
MEVRCHMEVRATWRFVPHGGSSHVMLVWSSCSQVGARDSLHLNTVKIRQEGELVLSWLTRHKTLNRHVEWRHMHHYSITMAL